MTDRFNIDAVNNVKVFVVCWGLLSTASSNHTD